MKKLLALVLALVMVLSLCVTSNAAFAGEEYDYDEAVEVMAAVGVFQGDENGKFNGKSELTREQAAKLVAYLDLGEKVAEALPAVKVFNDVEATRWSAKYVAYCADAGYLAGVGDGNFDPAGKLTGYAFGKMLLCALGYDAEEEEFTGSNWTIKVAKLMESEKLAKGVSGTPAATLTREAAAKYCFNAVQLSTVTYSGNGTVIGYDGDKITSITSAVAGVASKTGTTLMEKLYGNKLDKASGSYDAYGRPATKWYYNANGEATRTTKYLVGTYTNTADFTFTAETKAADVASMLAGYTYDGHEIEDKKTDVKAVAIADMTKNGKLVELFTDSKTITKIVEIETRLGAVSNIKVDKASTKDEDDRSFQVAGKTVAYEDDLIDNFDEVYDAVKSGDFVLYTLGTDGKVASVTIPEVITGKITAVSKGKVTVDGTVYEISEHVEGTPASQKAEQKIWLDTYGYIIKTDAVDDASDIVYLAQKYNETDKYNTPTNYAEVVTADGELVVLKLAAGSPAGDKGNLYTYTTNSKGASTLKAADTKEYVAITATTEIKAKAARVAGCYFADEVEFVYISGEKSDLKVTTASGVQAVKSVAANSYALLNKDDEVVTVFIGAKADTKVNADELVYVKSDTKVGTAVDAKDNVVDTYELYLDSEDATEVMMSAKPTVGWNTYSVDSETGVYTLEAVESTKAFTGKVNSITKAYLNVAGGPQADMTLADDCSVYDLSENDLNSLSAIKTFVDEGNNVTVSFIWDTTDKEITAMYVIGVAAPSV